MRAVLLRNGQLSMGETADWVLGPGELLLKTLSTTICASDVHFMDHPELSRDDQTGRSPYDADRDIVLGHEFVGEVIGHGPGCSEQYPVGTRVASIPIRLVNGGADGVRIIGRHPEAQGSFAELLVIPEISARPALAARGIDPIVVSDFQFEPRALAQDHFGAHITVDPAKRSPFDVFKDLRAERHLPGPAIVFECVGASGLIQDIVKSVEMGTRIYCAGGWYTGDTLNITDATRQGVTIQFGGGPMPQDWYGTLDAINEGRLNPLPSVGKVVDLDGVPDAIELARRSSGHARIVVSPDGDTR